MDARVVTLRSSHEPTGPAGPTPDDPASRAERALVARCLDGDTTAWRQLYDEQFPAVERLIWALGIRDAEAEDLIQEIFLLLHRSLKSFRGEARLGTWIHRIATREGIRFAKRRRLRRALAEMFGRERSERGPALWTEHEAGRRRYLQQLLERLPPERRLALVLFEIEGVAVADIARISGCAENTIWTRIHRARQQLESMAREGGSARNEREREGRS